MAENFESRFANRLSDFKRDAIYRIYAHNLNKIAAFLHRKKVKSFFIFQPVMSEKMERMGEGVDKEKVEGKTAFAVEDQKNTIKFYPLRRDIMKKIAGEYNIDFYSFQKIFDDQDDKDIYLDICHNTPYGLNIVAKE